jgi:hypothetical protein
VHADPRKFGEGVALVPATENTAKDTAFADDVNSFHLSVESLAAWWKLLFDFSIPSGLTVSAVKSKVNLLGKNLWSNDSLAPTARGMVISGKIKEQCPSLEIVAAQNIKTVGVYISVRDFMEGGNITTGTWSNRIRQFTPYAKALRYKLRDYNILDKIPAMNEGLSRLWYPALNCPIMPDQVSKISTLVDQIIWNYHTPLVARNIYTQPTDHAGGLKAPDVRLRLKSMQASWVKLFATGALPGCLSEYFRSQIIHTLTEVDKAPRFKPNVMTTWSDHKIAVELIKVVKENKAKEKLVWIPLYQALKTISELPPEDVPKEKDEWQGITAKSIYKLLKRSEVKGNTIIPGQQKWNIEQNINIDWEQLWRVAHSLKLSHRSLHDALYFVTIRRLIIPTKPVATQPPNVPTNANVPANAKNEYKKCSYCPATSGTCWNTNHAIFDCQRSAPVWEHLSRIILQDQPSPPVSKQQVFESCAKIPLTRKRKPNMSLSQLIILCTLTVMVKWIRSHTREESDDAHSALSDAEFKDKILEQVSELVKIHRPEHEMIPPRGIG